MTSLSSRATRFKLATLLMQAHVLVNLSACTPPKPKPVVKPTPVILLILVDVTRSLEPSEVQKVAELAADVLDRFPPNTDYTIYPIQWETERPTVIDQSHPKEPYVSMNPEEKKQRRDRLKTTIAQYFKEVNDKDKQPVDRTCILNALNTADRHFHETAARFSLEPGKTACMELVIISDMIEQCSIDSLNTRIDLKQKAIAENITIAKQISTFPNLSAIKISIIIPTAEDSTPFVRNRPRLADVEAFWDPIFLRAGFQKEQLREFNWLPTLPGRFDRVCAN